MARNYLNNLTDIIYNAPLWIQEVIFIDMKCNLQIKYPGLTTQPNVQDVYPAMRPEMTFKGKKELETREHGYDENVYKFLKSITDDIRIIDITLNNFWTLEQTSIVLSTCIKNELVKEPESILISSLILYLANEIRLGEYVKRIDKINVDELDNVLRKQKQHNEQNPNECKKIGEILIDFGYIAQNDINKIIHIKDEAKKRFIIPTEAMNKTQMIQLQTQPNNTAELDEKIRKLTTENNLLKDKLRAIFNIQNQKKQ